MIILGIIGIISLPNSCQFLHHHGVFVCFAYKITGIEGVALLIYGDLLFSQKRPFHRCFPLVHSKWTKWTSKWTSFYLHASSSFINFVREIKKSARDGASFEKNAYLCTVVINWRRIARSSKQRSTGKPGKFTLSDKEQSLRGASPMTNSCTPAPCGSSFGIRIGVG